MATESPAKRRPGRPLGSGRPPGDADQLNVRVPRALMLRLRRKATAERRTISAQVIYLLEQTLAK